MKTYVFEVELEKEDDVWTAVVPDLPGCNAWAKNSEDALAPIRENAQAYIETLIEDGLPVPGEKKHLILPLESPAVAVSV